MLVSSTKRKVPSKLNEATVNENSPWLCFLL